MLLKYLSKKQFTFITTLADPSQFFWHHFIIWDCGTDEQHRNPNIKKNSSIVGLGTPTPLFGQYPFFSHFPWQEFLRTGRPKLVKGAEECDHHHLNIFLIVIFLTFSEKATWIYGKVKRASESHFKVTS